MKKMLEVVATIILLGLLSAAALAEVPSPATVPALEEAPALEDVSVLAEEEAPERFIPDGPAHIAILENGVNLRAGGTTKDDVVGKGAKGDAFPFVGYADSGWLAFRWADGSTAYVSPTKAELRLGKAPIKSERVKLRVDYNKVDTFGRMPLAGEDIQFICPIFWLLDAQRAENQTLGARAMWCGTHKLFYDEEAIDEANWERCSVSVEKSEELLVLDDLYEALMEAEGHENIQKVSFEGSVEYGGQKKESFSGREWILYDIPAQTAFGGMTLLGDTVIQFQFSSADAPHMGDVAYRELAQKILASVHQVD